MSPTPLAVITGGGRGIGGGISRRLASEGYRILLTYHSDSFSAEKTVDVIREMGIDAVALKIDCSEPSEILLLSEHPWCQDGIEVLVLNHGSYERVAASELTDGALRKSMEINFFGAFGVWNSLKNQLDENARIVVIGSQLGIKGSPHGADYSASKAALHTWARSLAQDVGPFGQRINIIAPGYVDTAILAGDTVEKRRQRELEVPLQRIGQPSDIAGTVSFLCSEDSAYITGAVIHVNGGLFLP
jgi:3-oxoacyl-[acyl-carrier protein] reductase